MLIETALHEMDQVTVIVYDSPDQTPVPLTVRANWIRELYPSVTVVEAWDGPSEVGDAPEIRQKHEEYILQRLGIAGISHFYSSEFYGEHMSLALGAVNRLVDLNRQKLPISASQIRQDPFRWRHLMNPRVYRDLITKVVFLGAPCTGKTTVTARMAAEMDTLWMPEYGREYWEHHQVERRLSLEQLSEIARGHLQREETLLAEANRFLFVDTNATTTYIFSRYYHSQVDPQLVKLANQASTRYDLVFLCDTDIPYDDTWDRSGDANRHVMQKQIVSDLILRHIPFFVLRGNLQDRVDTVKRVLAQYHQYENSTDFWMRFRW